MKLDKIGPNTLKCVLTLTIVTKKKLEQLVFSSHSLSTNNRINNRLSPKSYNPLSYYCTVGHCYRKLSLYYHEKSWVERRVDIVFQNFFYW